MTKVFFYQNLASLAPKWPPLRQTFLSAGYVLGQQFQYVTEEPSDADYLLAVGDGALPVIRCTIPKERRILILMENPSIWTPPLDYLQYFGAVISPTSIPIPSGVRLILTQPAVSWFYGLKFRTDRGLSHEPVLEDFLQLNDLAEMPKPAKTGLISCVVSQKLGSAGHNWRVQTAIELKKYFGNEIDMFGFGWNPIEDKRDALDKYAFSIVIENESRENYWTEKLSDAILGYAQPIYAGAPNVNSFFEQAIPTLIYGVAPGDFSMTVKKLLESLPTDAELTARRNWVMYRHNIFYHIAVLIDSGLL